MLATTAAWRPQSVLAFVENAPTIAALQKTMSEDGSLNRITAKLGLLLLLLAPGIGCSTQNIRMPRLYNPGPAGYQQYNARQHSDPYPLPDAGPEIVGGRPRGFQTPRPEVERSRQFWQSRQQPQFVAPAPQPYYAPPQQ